MNTNRLDSGSRVELLIITIIVCRR